jgi:hypothetical protein
MGRRPSTGTLGRAAPFAGGSISSGVLRPAAAARDKNSDHESDSFYLVPTKNLVHVDFIDFRGIGPLALLA